MKNETIITRLNTATGLFDITEIIRFSESPISGDKTLLFRVETENSIKSLETKTNGAGLITYFQSIVTKTERDQTKPINVEIADLIAELCEDIDEEEDKIAYGLTEDIVADYRGEEIDGDEGEYSVDEEEDSKRGEEIDGSL